MRKNQIMKITITIVFPTRAPDPNQVLSELQGVCEASLNNPNP